MTPAEVQQYLHRHIPLSAAMDVAVVRAEPGHVELTAPLAPNINHRETVFGGSASALAILAAWTLLHVRLTSEGLDCRLVIQNSSVDYDRPMATDFSAVCEFGDGVAWERFVRTLHRHGRARIGIGSTLRCEGEAAGTFKGNFVALTTEQARPKS